MRIKLLPTIISIIGATGLAIAIIVPLTMCKTATDDPIPPKPVEAYELKPEDVTIATTSGVNFLAGISFGLSADRIALSKESMGTWINGIQLTAENKDKIKGKFKSIELKKGLCSDTKNIAYFVITDSFANTGVEEFILNDVTFGNETDERKIELNSFPTRTDYSPALAGIAKRVVFNFSPDHLTLVGKDTQVCPFDVNALPKEILVNDSESIDNWANALSLQDHKDIIHFIPKI